MSEKTKASRPKKRELTEDMVKELGRKMKEPVAYDIGNGDSIGEILDRSIESLKRIYKFPRTLTEDKAKSILREAWRTCNPNDKKFNAKKFGVAYRRGRLVYVRSMGDNLLQAFNTHISNLNFALDKATFNFNEGLTPKEYASITKDLATAVSLYQTIVDAHQPDAETTFDVIPALDSQIIAAELQEALSDTAVDEPQALPITNDTPKSLPPSEDSEDTDTD